MYPIRIICLLLLVCLTPSLATAQEAKTESKAAAKKTEAKKSDGKKAKKSEKEAAKKPPQLRQINLSGNYVDLLQPVSFDPRRLIIRIKIRHEIYVMLSQNRQQR